MTTASCPGRAKGSQRHPDFRHHGHSQRRPWPAPKRSFGDGRHARPDPFSGDDRDGSAPVSFLGLSLNSIIGTSVGARLVLQRRFNPARTMELVDEYDADALVAVPVMLQRILELDAETSKHFKASKLGIVTLSGSALPGGLATAWMDRYGDNIYNFYGSTEVAMGSIATPRICAMTRPRQAAAVTGPASGWSTSSATRSLTGNRADLHPQ